MLAMVMVRCRVCRHRERALIESSAATSPSSEVAAAFSLSELALRRHMERHDRVSGVVAIDEPIPDTLRSEGVAA